MSTERNQQDIVNKFLASLDNGQLVSEDVLFFGIESLLLAAPPIEEVKYQNISVPALKSLRGIVGFRDLAQAFLWAIKQIPGAVSFAWERVTPDIIEVGWVPGFSQHSDKNDEEIASIAENVFKCRGQMQAVEWIFGQPTVSITYQLPSTF